MVVLIDNFGSLSCISSRREDKVKKVADIPSLFRSSGNIFLPIV